jgi:hypothetical protein
MNRRPASVCRNAGRLGPIRIPHAIPQLNALADQPDETSRIEISICYGRKESAANEESRLPIHFSFNQSFVRPVNDAPENMNEQVLKICGFLTFPARSEIEASTFNRRFLALVTKHMHDESLHKIHTQKP